MKPVLIKAVLSSFLFCIFMPAHAQSLPMAQQRTGAWLYGAGMGSSLIFNNKEANLFRANGVATKMFGRYFWGKWGLAATTGFSAGSISKDGIREFTSNRGIAPGTVQITSSNPQNGYLLFGPSILLGNKISVSADAQAGLFLNNPGMVSIAQQGIDRPLYRFEAAGKNLFPGFAGSISFHYPVGKTTQFYFNADYMQTQSQINLLDLKNGIDVATKVSRDVKWMQAGVGIVKSFGGRRDKKEIADEPLAYMGNDPRKNKNTDAAPCGPVHITQTRPDGSSETIRFACPADALAYQNAQLPQGSEPLNNTGYSPRSTNGNKEDKANYFVYGRLSHIAGNLPGIVTNQTFNEKTASTSAAAFWVRDNANATNARRRTYAPIIVRNIADELCKDCIASVVGNPLYGGSTQSGTNPIYNGSKSFTTGENGQSTCSGTEGISVSLLSSVGNTVIATTKTGPCGEFFFANLPHDDYSLSFNGQMEKHIGYDVTLHTKADIAGLFNEQQEGSWMIEWSSNFGTDTEAAGIVKNMTIATSAKAATDNGQGNLMLHSMVVNIWSPRSNFNPEELENGTANFQKRTTGGNGKSIRVTAGKKGAAQMMEVNTDGAGAFEIAGLQKGIYFVKAAIPLAISKKVKVDIKTWGDPHEGPEHYNSINNRKGWDGSVKGNSFAEGEQQRKGWDGSVKGNSFTDEAQQRKGWDGSVKGNSKMEAQDFNTTRSNKDNRIVINPGGNGTLSAQDFNTTRSNKDNRLITNNSNTNSAAPAQLAGQDFNTTRSNKDNRLVSVSVDADMDGDGIFETDVSSKISDVIILDSNWIEKTPAALKKISNRNSITEIGNGLFLSFGTAIINGKEVRVQSVLKTRHETAKNSIGNVR